MLGFYKQIRRRYPAHVLIYLVNDNLVLHWTPEIREWAELHHVELVPTPTSASYMNRIECHFTALSYFALAGTDHRSHEEQNSAIRRYIAWRNRNRHHPELHAISMRAKVA